MNGFCFYPDTEKKNRKVFEQLKNELKLILSEVHSHVCIVMELPCEPLIFTLLNVRGFLVTSCEETPPHSLLVTPPLFRRDCCRLQHFCILPSVTHSLLLLIQLRNVVSTNFSRCKIGPRRECTDSDIHLKTNPECFLLHFC